MSKTYIAAIGITGLVLIVFVAIGADMLPLLIGGVIVLGLISLGLFSVGVGLFSRFTDSVLKREALRFEHAERAMSKGFIPEGRGFLTYRQIQTARPEPVKQIAEPVQGVHFTDSELETNVVNLLAFSVQLLGENSNRIASGPECAQANIPGYNGRKWDKMIHEYLEPKYSIATIPGPVKNGGGAYVPDSIGTIGKLYHDVLFRNSTNALPTIEK